MKMRKIGKVLLVWLCIFTLLLPFCSEVLAAVTALSSMSEGDTAILATTSYRQGGSESAGLADADDYDTTAYQYRVSSTNVLKIIQSGDTDYTDLIYCINALGSFPQYTTETYTYTNRGDFTDSDNAYVEAWQTKLGLSDDDYEDLVNLLTIIYLMKQDTSYKYDYIKNAFSSEIASLTAATAVPKMTEDEAVSYIATLITDDDIDVVQQWAIWYFTNRVGTDYTAGQYHETEFDDFGDVQVSYDYYNSPTDNGTTAFADLDTDRQELMTTLYSYLITEAQTMTSINGTVTYPSIDDASTTVSSTVDGSYYKVGPFKINSGTYTPSDLTATFAFTDSQSQTVSNVDYILKDASGNTVTAMDYDTEYYVYLPISGNTVATVELTLKYTTQGEREITIWTGESDGSTTDLQDVVVVSEGTGTEVETTKQGIITEVEYDLALRKYIVSVNGIASGRTITVDIDGLKSGDETAAYYQTKDPITVEAGDTIVYQFNIYNEGDIDAIVGTIVDYLPAGLSLATNSNINTLYGWTEVETYSNGYTKVTSDYLNNSLFTIDAFDGSTLDYQFIQIECVIDDDATSGSVLTNVAEIVSDDGDDRDSNTSSIDPETLSDSFSGNTSNPTDLSQDDYYYKGLEDDDDFEKVIIAGDVFDLALKKFISDVNGTEYDREPEVDTSSLATGTDATYTTNKSAVTVQTGDIITFTIRVYNEGNVDGYADEITDYIPEGLGFLVNYQTNYDNKWELLSSETYDTTTLSEITNGTNNVTSSDFTDSGDLEDEVVVLGEAKIATTALAYSDTSTTNLIAAYDGGTTLSYKDVQITCIVVAEDEVTLKNIAAITGEKDETGTDVDTDRGSTSTDSTPKDDIDPDSYTTGNEDDDDYDVVKTSPEDFDLALQKFITGLNDESVSGREPTVTIDSDGNISYAHTSSALSVGNGDYVTYTIRVYNEGDIDGYASEIADDIPTGLVYVEDNEINKKYGWAMYDSSGNVTTDSAQAVEVRTTYLKDTLLKAFDGTTLSYADVQIVFQIDETAIDKTTTTETRTFTNTAEITEAKDGDGNPIDDIDSTPDNGNLNEDDIDQEKVYVKYFDLALSKDLQSAIVTVDGTSTTYNVADGEDSIKVEVNRKKASSTVIQFVYNITVTNEGEIAGYATEVTDYIPTGLYFESSDNPDWTQTSEKVITTDALAKTLLQPGESASVQVILRWEQSEDNTGKFINIAEITEDWNEYGSDDVDSTPDNLVSTEDDYDTAPVYVSISTGLGDQPYIILTTAVLAILGTGIFLIKKYVL